MKSLNRPVLTSLSFAVLILVAEVVSASTQPYITSHQINFGTGNKYLQSTDVRLSNVGPSLSFTRTYNSQSEEISALGYGWTAPLTERLLINPDKITLVQSSGRYVHFHDDGSGNYINTTGGKRVITETAGGYRLEERSGSVKLYGSGGKLQQATDRNGNSRHYDYTDGNLTQISDDFGASLSFTYTGDYLSGITAPHGTFSYDYDGDNNLTSVTKPGGATITYIYDDPNDIHNLTGVVNEEGERVLTVEYDASDRVIHSAKQGGANEVNISYPANYLRKVTNSLGVETTYHLDVLHGIVKVGSFSGPGCSSCGSSSDMSYLYDNRFRVKEATDAKGTVTSYTYDDNGNKLNKTEATGTPQERITTYTYTAGNRVKTITVDSIANPSESAVTTMDYDSNGNLTSRTEQGYEDGTPISRITSYSYDSLGRMTAINGPRTDVNDTVTMAYYANEAALGNNRGRLKTVTNALGHTTTYADYNIHGQAESITDANGLVTTRDYNNEGRLISTTTAGLTTTYVYDAAGDLQSITRPGDRTITYGYDTTGRVNRITDDQGNSIGYTYDSEGRKTGQQVHDPNNDLKRYTNFEYNDAGRLSKILLPGNAERIFDYDSVGNLVQQINATGLQTDMSYDIFDRLTALTEMDETTGYQYDSQGNVTQVTDAKGNVTSFSYDDFGRRTSRTAPDTGLTLYSYDKTGNIKSIIDALGRNVQFEYDALNRPTSQSYDSTTISYNYDTGATGRLAGITDEHGSRSFSYNQLGQITEEIRQIDGTGYTTGYGYNSTTGDLETITYPSGMVVKYHRNAAGEITSLSIDGQTIIDAVTHLPFGPLKTATLGNTTMTRQYDQRYNLSSIKAGELEYDYRRDEAGHVTAILGKPETTPTEMDEEYGYENDSNRIASREGITYTLDAVGNTTSDGTRTFIYDALNRLIEVQEAGTTIATYGYDASNRRITKTVGTTTTHYLYDSGSNLIAETRPDGTVLREYINLNGEVIALNDYNNTPGLYYYINDHLGTPQQLIEADGTVVWQAAYLPFGQTQVTIEQVVNNIRFPGQFYDDETGLHYNFYRYYDPETGRYISADPIGLAGGMNLYAYVGGDPVNIFDPLGLFGAGGPDDDIGGHGDFHGSDCFDFNREDDDPNTSPWPWGNPPGHFQPLGQSEAEARRAIAECDKEAFERAMHRGQDYFSHYSKGYRWDPGNTDLPCWGWGHGCDGTEPDKDPAAWLDAETWSYPLVEEFKSNCPCICKGK